MSFISQFISRIIHINGRENITADSLSRIESLRLPCEIELLELAKLQKEDPQLPQLLKSTTTSLKLQRLILGSDHSQIYCEISNESFRPYIPVSLRRKVFDMFHSPKITDRTIRQRYVWPHMHRDIANWAKNCLDCQQSKISRHVKLLPTYRFHDSRRTFRSCSHRFNRPLTNKPRFQILFNNNRSIFKMARSHSNNRHIRPNGHTRIL